MLAIALLVRLPGIGAQLPWELHPDEGHYVWKAFDMVQDGNLNPKYFRNPSLYTYLLFAEFKPLSLFDPASEGWPAANIESLRPPSLYVWLGRLTATLLGVATTCVVVRLGTVLIGRWCGLIGGVLLGLAFIHLRDSQFATNDVPATFLLMLSVLWSARLAHSGRRKDMLLAALFGGLATSTKYNVGFFVVPLLAGYALAHRRSALKLLRLPQLLAAAAVALGAYLLGTPFTILAWPTFRDDFLVQQRFARDGWEGQGPQPVWQLYLAALEQGLGSAGLGLALLGLVLMLRRRPAAACLLSAFPLTYLVFMLNVKLFFVRFAVPLAPFLCLAAAYGILELGRLVRAGPARLALTVALLGVTLVQPVWNILELQRIMAQADTRAWAYAWLESNLPVGARIVVDDYSVRDRRPRADLPDRSRFDLDIVSSISERDLESYRQRGYQYAVVSSFQYQRFGGRYSTYADLDASAPQLALVAPTVDGGDLPFDIEDLYAPYYDLGRHARPGPTVKIYQLSQAAR